MRRRSDAPAETVSADPGLPCDVDLRELLATVIADGPSGNAEVVFCYEDAAADHFGARWAISTSSGTTALYAALVALDITAGDEVVLPATAPAMSLLPILAVGATPIICDTRTERSFGLSTDDLITILGPRTRAVLFVPMWGYWDEAPETLRLLDRSDLATVLDASQAHHLRTDGGLTALADIACLSTHARKPLSTGEGGLLLTRHEDLAAKARSARNFGQPTKRDGRRLLPSGPFGITFGLNLKINGLGAALGLANLAKLPEDLIRRRAAAEELRTAIAAFAGREHSSAPGVAPALYGFCFSAPGVARSRLATAVTELVEVETERYGYDVLASAPIAAAYRRPCPNADTLVRSTCSMRLQDVTSDQAQTIGTRLTAAAASGWPELPSVEMNDGALLKHATASTFVYDVDTHRAHDLDKICVLLLWHPKFSCWMIPGGHVEPYENCAEAATREVHEETGLDIVLVPREQTTISIPADSVALPWAIFEQRIPARATEAEHIHVDHLYVARRAQPDAAPVGAEWVKLEQLASRAMFEQTRTLALQFARTPATAA